MKSHPPAGAVQRARNLRRNPTDAEKLMWRLLRDNFPSALFRRQVPLRHYIADFATHSARLVIEIDGGQHDEAGDALRTKVIEREGYRVLRFWNNDVLGNPDGVLAVIDAVLREQHPHLTSPIKGLLQNSFDADSLTMDQGGWDVGEIWGSVQFC